MLSGEATNTNFIVFGLTRPRLEPTIYCAGGEHANHYATDAILHLMVQIRYALLSNIDIDLSQITDKLYHIMLYRLCNRKCVIFEQNEK